MAATCDVCGKHPSFGHSVLAPRMSTSDMNANNHETTMQAIITAHASRLALPASVPAVAQFSSTAPVYRAAKSACHGMGFIDIDAAAGQALADRLQQTGGSGPRFMLMSEGLFFAILDLAYPTTIRKRLPR